MTKSRKLRRSFDPEFKREAVRLLEERRAQGATVAGVARELGLRPAMLRDWALQLTAAPEPRPPAGPPGAGESLEQEVRRLRREVARLQEEAAFAKKAAAFFARESR
jgi:transposase